MLLKVFTVYDSKSEAYLQPFYRQTSGEAIRSFTDTCNDESTMFSKHPADFTLFEIGTFDDKKAQLKMLNAMVSLGTALEYKGE